MPPKLSETDVFVLLAKQRRRLIIQIVDESAAPLTTMELAERIGEREQENPSSEDLRTVYLSLYHNHLPRLDDAGVVVYDPDEGTVHPHANFDVLVRVLDGVNEQDLPWSDG